MRRRQILAGGCAAKTHDAIAFPAANQSRTASYADYEVRLMLTLSDGVPQRSLAILQVAGGPECSGQVVYSRTH